jgi:hypothetical protein
VVVVAAAAAAVAMSVPGKAAPRGPTAAQRQEAAVRAAASAWIVRYIAPGTTIGCDRQMCAVLRAHGIPAADVRTLGPRSNPLSAQVIVATPTVRSLFGSYLSSEDAPLVLTRIGTGRAFITVRVVAPHGAAAYLRALAADRQERKLDGTELLGSRQIVTSPVARSEMAAGMVDTRLLFAITALAGAQPIDIVDFGNISVGASATVPLRYADLVVPDNASGLAPAAYIAALRDVLGSVPAEYKPALTASLEQPNHVHVLRIVVAAPSPLGLLAPTPSAS